MVIYDQSLGNASVSYIILDHGFTFLGLKKWIVFKFLWTTLEKHLEKGFPFIGKLK